MTYEGGAQARQGSNMAAINLPDEKRQRISDSSASTDSSMPSLVSGSDRDSGMDGYNTISSDNSTTEVVHENNAPEEEPYDPSALTDQDDAPMQFTGEVSAGSKTLKY